MFNNHLRHRRKPVTGSEQAIAPAGSFKFSATTSKPQTSWGTWLQNQPAPDFKPGHRLPHLSIYFYGSDQEYEISLDLAERWGYALNVGYGDQIDQVIADARTATPQTSRGRLLKLALANPAKYPVAGAVLQKPQDFSTLPNAYLKDANGVGIDFWSPELDPTTKQAVIDYKMAAVRKLVSTGAKVVTCYDGGEADLDIPLDAANRFGRDPRVVAAKGSREWISYISEKKADLHGSVFQAVKAALPDLEYHVYYPCTSAMYSNVPAWDSYQWHYQYMRNTSSLPSGSVYYKDFFASAAGMTNPDIKDRSYWDQLTQWTGAVGEQITYYGHPLSYNFVSAGYGHGRRNAYGALEYDPAEIMQQPNQYFMSIEAYKGFLKCMYATGMIGGVAGYFSEDSVQGRYYPTYNPSNPPHWLLQEQALGEIHARFSWLEEYLFDADLLPGDTKHVLKGDLPSYEYSAYTFYGGFLQKQPGVRVFCRKIRNMERWLIVLCTAEKGNGDAGDNVQVMVRTIPGLGEVSLVSRGIGSMYTVSKQNGNNVVQQVDAV